MTDRRDWGHGSKERHPLLEARHPTSTRLLPRLREVR